MAKKLEWTDAARADVRRVDRETAMLRMGLPGVGVLAEGGNGTLVGQRPTVPSFGTAFRWPFAFIVVW